MDEIHESTQVEGLQDLTEKVDTLVQVLQEQIAEPTPEEIEAQQQLQEQQQLVLQQQIEDEMVFRQELLLSLEELNTNTIELIEKNESIDFFISEVSPYVKQASEWLLIAIVVWALLWVVKQFEDMFNAAFK